VGNMRLAIDLTVTGMSIVFSVLVLVSLGMKVLDLGLFSDDRGQDRPLRIRSPLFFSQRWGNARGGGGGVPKESSNGGKSGTEVSRAENDIGDPGPSGIRPEIVAAIAGALTAYLDEPLNRYRIVDVRRISVTRQSSNAWGAMGRSEIVAGRGTTAGRKESY